MTQMGEVMTAATLQQNVDEAVQRTPVIDIHTHLLPASFGDLCLWGIDELVNYHYLVAELFRSSSATPQQFWALTKSQQADMIWDALFVKNTPLSEATAGVVAVMTRLGLDPAQPNLRQAREYFASVTVEQYIDQVLKLAHVSEIVMTNDPFNPAERAMWEQNKPCPENFHRALRMDPVLNDWDTAHAVMAAAGFKTSADLTPQTITEARRFLDLWIARMRPVYLAVSMPFTFAYPDDSLRTSLIQKVVLPTCLQHNIPFALMIGVSRQVNPALKDAGDSVGFADTASVERLCSENPGVRFLVTLLARENQHALCVAARKFNNLMPFGCWWFLNNPSIIDEITSERLELLGATTIPQHSDARILDQLIYKWQHSRRAISRALYESYSRLIVDGYPLTRKQIDRDVQRMFSGNFRKWVGLPETGAH
ncbi:MAG: glucuronate isomerase [Acidobacteriota bacterium]|nr:glucuronate isomerase [Acidobacteriota bacterium]